MNLAKANVILAAAAVVLAIPTFLTLRSDASMFKALDEVPKLFPGFTPENVGAVAIGVPKPDQPKPAANPQNPNAPKPPLQYDQQTFVRTGTGWAVGAEGELQGAPVQANLVEKWLLQHLQDVRYDRDVLVAENASDEDLAKYGLDETEALVIKAYDKGMQNVVAELLMGKDAKAGNADNVSGFYVRRRDSKDVVLYEGQIQKPNVKIDVWLDRSITHIDPATITQFAYSGPATSGREVSFAKKPGSQATWTAAKAPDDVGAVRQQEVESMVQRFCNLYAQEIKRPLAATNTGELGLVPPRFTVSATTKDDSGEKTWTLTIGNKVDDKDEYYVQSSQSQFLMTLPQHMVAPFQRNPKELFDPAPETVKPDPPKDEAPKDEAPKDGTPKEEKKSGG